MKKILLLSVLLITSYQLFAFTTQGVWRWRNDDGSETSATWRADQGTSITISNTDSILRLRIELYNNGTGGTLDNAVFEDSSSEAGSTWTIIGKDPGESAFVLAGSSPFVTDLEPTTHQLNGQGTPYTFDPGQVIVSSETLPAHTVAQAKTTEYEYAIKPSANIKPGVTYYFRVDAAYYLIGYTFPSLTTAAVLPVHFSNFTVKPDKNRVLISWTTASEQNNNHFNVERSTNGSTFTTIASVGGNGTSSIAHTYTAYDPAPYNGTNYYRIKQYDNDGRAMVSAVKSLKMLLTKTIVNAYPNPSRGDINFSLQGYPGGTMTASLINISGKTVHSETIETNASNSNYKLNLKTKLAPGVYVLQLKGNALSENIKISVQ